MYGKNFAIGPARVPPSGARTYAPISPLERDARTPFRSKPGQIVSSGGNRAAGRLDGPTLSAEVDPETGRIHRTIAHIPFDRLLEGLEFINEYSDFREVNGVLFAFKEVTYAQGQHTSDITLEEVKTYDVLPAEHFDPDPSAASS